MENLFETKLTIFNSVDSNIAEQDVKWLFLLRGAINWFMYERFPGKVHEMNSMDKWQLGNKLCMKWTRIISYLSVKN